MTQIIIHLAVRDDSTGLMRAIAMRHQQVIICQLDHLHFHTILKNQQNLPQLLFVVHQVVDELLLHPDIDINLPGMDNDITPLHVNIVNLPGCLDTVLKLEII